MPHPPQIPLTPQTNERNFPVHDPKAPPGRSGHPYPRMLTRPFTKADREAWLEKNKKIDVVTRQEHYEERCPKLGDPWPIAATQECVDAGFANQVGEPMIVADDEDEDLVYETLGMEKPAPQAQMIAVPIASPRLKELEAENAKLRAQLAGKPVAATPKAKPKKKAKRKAAAKAKSFEEFAGAGSEEG